MPESSSGTAPLELQQGRSKAGALYQVGLEKLQLGDVRGAYEDLKEAARIEPSNREIWLKYEETYKRVAPEIDQEHLIEFQHTANQVDEGFSLGEPGALENGPPPRFRFEATNAERPRPLQTTAESQDAEARERALALQEGILRGVFEGSRGHKSQAVSSSSQRSKRQGPDVDSVGWVFGRGEIDVHIQNTQVWMTICVCWLSVAFNVFYYFHEEYSPDNHADVIVALLVCVTLAFLCWRFIRRGKPLRMSMTDVIKVICILFISVCVAYFYVRQLQQAKDGQS